jgi:F-type H+-transporting ATPase subunit delta
VRDATVARNYAEALLETAQRHGVVERCGELLDAVAGVWAADPRIRGVFMSPRIAKEKKQRLIGMALEGVAPVPFVRFLQAVVQRGRQGMATDISAEYLKLVDAKLDRVHAVISTARPADEALRRVVTKRLTAVFGKTVRPHFRTEPALLGGIVVRSGDRIFDGSLRRRLRLLRHRMLHAPLGESVRAK